MPYDRPDRLSDTVPLKRPPHYLLTPAHALEAFESLVKLRLSGSVTHDLLMAAEPGSDEAKRLAARLEGTNNHIDQWEAAMLSWLRRLTGEEKPFTRDTD